METFENYAGVDASEIVEGEVENLVGSGPPRGPVPQHCCIVSSYDCGGDGCGGMGCPYLAFCGPTGGDGQTSSNGGNAYEYACWCGCNLADPLACLPPRRLIITDDRSP